jgi:transposase
MAWTSEHRRAADRRRLRYPSDLADAEWALVAPLIRPAKRGGRPRKVDVRELLNAVFYVLSTGSQWRSLRNALLMAAVADSLRGSATVARRRWVIVGSDRRAWRRRCCRRAPVSMIVSHRVV